jgi:YD repeat-containing protein
MYRLARQVDKNGNTIYDDYNGGGTLARITDIQRRVTSLGYATVNGTTVLTDPIGRARRYGYTGGGPLQTVTDPTGVVTTYSYQDAMPLANFVQITDPLGHVTPFVYDGNRRVTSVTVGTGSAVAALTTFSYQPGTTIVTAANGHETSYVCDP